MADVFISWGSPDRTAVQALCRRLRESGVSLFEYSYDMVTGDDIRDRVWREIHRAGVVVVCLSEPTAGREWIQTEIAWCFQGSRPLKPVLPVRVGPLADEQVPHLLRTGQLYTFDLESPKGTGEDLLRLTADILDKLGRGAPQVIPAALFAMTEEECGGLFEQWKADSYRHGPASEALHRLCNTLGMAGPPELFDLLRQRYGPEPEDLSPFQPGRRLIDLIHESLARVNEARVRARRRPLFLRWIQRELSERSLDQGVRDLWRGGDSLLVIDSVSTFCESVSDRIERLPDSRERSRSALLWIPPYTQLTAHLEEPLGTTVRGVGALGDVFADLDQELGRPVAFDVGTSLALRLWLLRSLSGLPDAAGPLQEPLQEMGSRGVHPGQLLGFSPRAA